MEATLYWGTMHLVSEQIHEILDDSISFYEILEQVYYAFKSDISYEEKRPIYTSDGTKYEETISYKTKILRKENMVIEGFICKNSYVRYNSFNEDTYERAHKKVPNVEATEFRLDMTRESVVYHRAQRFGYAEILKAFEGIINKCCEVAQLPYIFKMSQGKEGINLDTIRNDIKTEQLSSISVIYNVPNVSSKLLDKIRENREKNLTDFKNANLQSKEVVFKTLSPKGLNVSAKMIQEELDNIEALHTSIDSEIALENDYVVVETMDIYGNRKSSKDSRPFTKTIDDKSLFQEEANKLLVSKDKIRADQ